MEKPAYQQEISLSQRAPNQERVSEEAILQEWTFIRAKEISRETKNRIIFERWTLTQAGIDKDTQNHIIFPYQIFLRRKYNINVIGFNDKERAVEVYNYFTSYFEGRFENTPDITYPGSDKLLSFAEAANLESESKYLLPDGEVGDCDLYELPEQFRNAIKEKEKEIEEMKIVEEKKLNKFQKNSTLKKRKYPTSPIVMTESEMPDRYDSRRKKTVHWVIRYTPFQEKQ